MPPTTRYCPKCGSVLNVPHPAPEKMPCHKCGAILRFGPAKSSSQAVLRAPAYAAAAVAVNKTVAGHQLQRELARGGLGVIYLAFHPHLHDFRAIKRPLPGDAADRDVLLGRFRREVQAIAGMHSPHVIRAYDAGEDADGPYLVTEYLDGEALSGLVTRLCMLPVPEACEIARQAALGLQAAHERGLVHRDIKPSNLMLARGGAGAGRVVVIDWGLVKSAADAPANRLTRVHTEMGTLDFIAPEQILDAHSVDIRADIYSLGITLFCLLAGQPPFANRSDDEKRQAHAREKFPRLDQLRPTIPRPVLDILEKMVKKNPAERYQTPGEVARVLQPFGCEAHQLLALLAPGASAVPTPRPVGQATPLQMKNILEAGTVLAPTTPAPTHAANLESVPPLRATQPTAPAAGPPRRSRGLMLFGLAAVALIAFLVCGGGVVGMVLWDNHGTTKDSAPGSGPQVLIDEDFRKAYEEKQLPKGWEGDAFRVIKENDLYALEDSRLKDAHFVNVPLSKSLAGNFAIEGVYWMGNPAWANHHLLTISLSNRSKSALLAIVFDWDGHVTVGDEPMSPPPNHKPLLPTDFVVKREGKKLRIFLNKEPLGDKNLSEVADFDTLRIGMVAGPANGGKLERLYGLKVSTLP